MSQKNCLKGGGGNDVQHKKGSVGRVVLGYNIGPKGPPLEPNFLCFSRGSRFFCRI